MAGSSAISTGSRSGVHASIPSGVSIGSVLTSTATLGGQTSEFGGNVTVTSGPNLTYLKSVAVFSDPLNNTTNPKSIPGAMQVYTLRVQEKPVGAVLRELSQRLHWAIQIDEDAIRAAGKSLDKLRV